MNPIDLAFARLREAGRKAFVPFVTAGDPHLAVTTQVMIELGRRGAALIEIGIPYSDPIADGSVIQASYTRALGKGLKVEAVWTALRGLAASSEWRGLAVPLAVMVSYSLVHHRGVQRFIDEARAAGVSGAIVPDLPVEEAEELARLGAQADFKIIQLVTPTTPRERATRIAQCSTGFLYCVSVVGITGERQKLPADLDEQLRWLRGQTALPLCVGFGISAPEQVRRLRDAVDGVIVGSALVRKLGEIGTRPAAEVIAEIGAMAQSFEQALNG